MTADMTFFGAPRGPVRLLDNRGAALNNGGLGRQRQAARADLAVRGADRICAMP